ncbi:hypothetical protein K4L44_17190 [Halosquirtibacter laminarini]|uniref:Uncharacterized protein n=1 Tax=Halosquirtibacter laminarini TaxID=3374600 RepID=A0AC61NF51_9BACT|nr:hypothetical protein K4L44_17190 [Prolixibacteraceae bacterium]
MKYVILLFMFINTEYDCFSKDKSTVSQEEVAVIHEINDCEIRGTGDCKEMFLTLKDSTFTDFLGDSTLATGYVSIQVERSIRAIDFIDFGENDICASADGELIHGKREGEWKISQYLNESYPYVRKMRYVNNILDGDCYIYDTKDKLIDTLTFKQGTGGVSGLLSRKWCFEG